MVFLELLAIVALIAAHAAMTAAFLTAMIPYVAKVRRMMRENMKRGEMVL